MSYDLLCAVDLPLEHSFWQTLRNLGHRVQHLTDWQHLPRVTVTAAGQAVLVGPGLARGTVSRLAGHLESSGLPLVVVLPAGSADLPLPAEAPVYGYLPADATPGQAAAVLAAAVQVFGHVFDLGTRLQRLEAQWEQRKVVERAKGVLMARQGLSEDQAHRLLQSSSMKNRQPMAEIARRIVAGSLVP